MASKPNVVFLIADDHRHDSFGFTGNPDVQTPNLDRLAAEGVSFSNACIHGGFTAAVCAPSRACMMTGVNAYKAHKCHDLDAFPRVLAIREGLTLLPEAFGAAGYKTHMVGKWHNDREALQRGFCSGGKICLRGMDDHRATHVFDFDPTGAYPDENEYVGEKFSTDMFADEAIRYLNEDVGVDDPFFLYLAFTAPHDPFTPPGEYSGMYEPSELSLPSSFMERHPFDHGDYHVRFENAIDWPRDPLALGKLTAHYYGMISHMDYRIGHILETLRARGLDKNTIVVYTGDHGLSMGSHGLLGKASLYEHAIKVPLIINSPNLPAGARHDSQIYSNDLYPTLCDLAGVPVPETVETPSLVPIIEGGTDELHDRLFSIYKQYQRMVRKGPWKLIRYFRDEQRGEGTNTVALFNMNEDPGELHNRAQDPACRNVRDELEMELHTYMAENKDFLLDEINAS